VAALHTDKDTSVAGSGLSGSDLHGSNLGHSRIGGELRDARERLGWEIDAVAEALRLKPAFIRAIETGDIQGLPGTAYAVGFVRTYATALGLDPNEAIRRFRAERDEVNRKTELDFPAPVPQRGIPAGALVLVGAVVAIAGYIGWYHYSGRSDRTASAVDPVPTHLEPLAPPTPTPRMAVVTPAAPKPAVVAVNPTPSGPLPNDADVSPSSAAAAVPMPAPVVIAAPPPAATAPMVAENTPAVPAPVANAAAVAAPGTMVIQATADAWIEIKNGTGRVVYQKVLHSGDSYTVPDQPQLTLTTGNASGTQIVLGGNTLGSLKGHVLRNLPLDPDSLKAQIVPISTSAPATTGTPAPAAQ
jgi:cytoskeleton protein RodZ